MLVVNDKMLCDMLPPEAERPRSDPDTLFELTDKFLLALSR